MHNPVGDTMTTGWKLTLKRVYLRALFEWHVSGIHFWNTFLQRLLTNWTCGRGIACQQYYIICLWKPIFGDSCLWASWRNCWCIKHTGSENHSKLCLLCCALQAAMWLSMSAVVQLAAGEGYLRELFFSYHFGLQRFSYIGWGWQPRLKYASLVKHLTWKSCMSAVARKSNHESLSKAQLCSCQRLNITNHYRSLLSLSILAQCTLQVNMHLCQLGDFRSNAYLVCPYTLRFLLA